jgi:hypothetical protein
LIQDKSFKKAVEAYAKDESLFFKEYVLLPTCLTSSNNLDNPASPPPSPN